MVCNSASTTTYSLTRSTDAFLYSFLDMLPSSNYSVIYTTSAITSQEHRLQDQTVLYEMDPTFASPTHMELKREFSVHKRNTSNGNVTLVDGPLFERYQFFTPGKIQNIVLRSVMIQSLNIIRSLHGHPYHTSASHDSLRCCLRSF